MPRSILDDVADKPFVSMTRFPGGLQTLKRGRTMEPRLSPPPCAAKCCVGIKESIASCPFSQPCRNASNKGPMFEDYPSFDGALPEDEFEDFDLGPPPPSGPVLVRQNAMDMTALAETKLASLSAGSMPRQLRSVAGAPGTMPTRGPSSQAFALPPMRRNT